MTKSDDDDDQYDDDHDEQSKFSKKAFVPRKTGLEPFLCILRRN